MSDTILPGTTPDVDEFLETPLESYEVREQRLAQSRAKHPTTAGTGQFTRVPDSGPQIGSASYALPLAAAGPILRRMSRSGRADLMEAIADMIDPTTPSDGITEYEVDAAAWMLRLMAARERRS